MKKSSVIVIIQARKNSTRLPAKVLLPLGNDTMLGYMIKRIKLAKVDDIIVATTKNDSDEIIEIAKKNNVKYFEGSEENVMLRMIDAAKYYELQDEDYICDISGDCPFVQASMINYLIRKIKKENYDYISNDVISRSWPDGLDCQIYKYAALKAVYHLITNPNHFSHSGWNIPTYGSHIFSIGNWRAPEKYHWPNLGLTLDEEKDYIFLKSIYDKFSNKKKYPQPFSIFTVINFLKKCPDFITNADIKRKIPEVSI